MKAFGTFSTIALRSTPLEYFRPKIDLFCNLYIYAYKPYQMY